MGAKMVDIPSEGSNCGKEGIPSLGAKILHGFTKL